jgi:hypothetical protein
MGMSTFTCPKLNSLSPAFIPSLFLCDPRLSEITLELVSHASDPWGPELTTLWERDMVKEPVKIGHFPGTALEQKGKRQR